ncbi:MaoC like domain-containing protein [Mycena rosella]|uniref:MaoC like domain-containing protein n=1 Tax=Mycena rosella TaxID=1033263 RepID=A0AAD7DY38_MYCRO|nr:MaoC like domain-containing protein [Mycena rosella]
MASPEESKLVAEAKKIPVEPTHYSYTERDVILYNLGIGATEMDLQRTYEGDDEFWAAKLLHGEQFLSIKAPIPTSGELINHTRLLKVLDKGKAAAVTSNQSTFIRGSGGFGGQRTGSDRGAATAVNATSSSPAALYRLSGDLNPLHILPEFTAIGGFNKSILHGLCSMGISGKHVFQKFGPYKDIKVRFTGVVYPGETLITEMWKEGAKIIFTTKVIECDTIVLASAAATLVDGAAKAKF